MFHKTHNNLVHYLNNYVDEVVIGLGSSQYGYNNPKPGELRVKHCLNLDERIELLNRSLGDIKKEIVPLEDYPTDIEWIFNTVYRVGKVDCMLTEKKDEVKQFNNYCNIILWPYEGGVRNGFLINQIIQGNNYSHLLPKPAYDFLQELNIRDRLIELHEQDVKQYGTLENYFNSHAGLKRGG